MSLPAEAREQIRQARDRAARSHLTVDTRGRRYFVVGLRKAALAEVCLDAAHGDSLLALSFAADFVDAFGVTCVPKKAREHVA